MHRFLRTLTKFPPVFKVNLNMISRVPLQFFAVTASDREEIKELKKIFPPSKAGKEFMAKNNLRLATEYIDYAEQWAYEHLIHTSTIRDLRGFDTYTFLFETDKPSSSANSADRSSEDTPEKLSLSKCYCLFTPNEKLQGHPGLLHGGYTAVLFDEIAYVSTCHLLGVRKAMTAYLNTSYSKPAFLNVEYVIEIEITKIQGRKLFLQGVMKDYEDNIYAKADILYILVENVGGKS